MKSDISILEFFYNAQSINNFSKIKYSLGGKTMLKKIISLVLCTAMVIGLCITFPQGTTIANAAPAFANGADIGWLNQMENMGISWQNSSGVQKDPLQILKDSGVNSVRLRVFVNPPSNFTWQKTPNETCILGYGDKTGVVWMAQRANALGMRIMIDFHYSDHFADPAYQDKPAAWTNYTFSQLKTAVYEHTYDVMSALANVGIYPEWVQVGNEINAGLLWPEGKYNNFSQLSQLLNSGYDAVKAVSSSSKVVTHLANGYDNSVFRWFFDNFINTYGGKTDVIGMSYYPYWSGVDYTQNINALGTNLNDMASRYNKEVMVVEVGGLESNATNTYNLLRATIDKVKAVPNSKGLGVFYWEPQANSTVLPDGYSLGATTAISNTVLRFTSAIDAFKSNSENFPDTSATYAIYNRNSGKVLNVVGGSSTDGANIEQYTYNGWNSQKWKFIDSGNGYYKIKNVQSGKIMDIYGRSTADGANNIQWTDNGGYNQQWQLINVGSGYYKIKNRNSGKILDIEGASTADGALDIQWYDNGGYNQMWYFVKVD
jgi:arabinogalactan endo-1,4-beta-galactosidase